MPKVFRPNEISWWFQIGRRRFGEKNIPTIDSVEEFEASWIKWWTAGQPEWRDTEDWPFEMGDATGKDWCNLPDGGKDGIFVVIVSLAWWVCARGSSGGRKLDEALTDVTWVLDGLISYLSTCAITPDSPPASPPTQPRKRPAPTKTYRATKQARLQE